MLPMLCTPLSKRNVHINYVHFTWKELNMLPFIAGDEQMFELHVISMAVVSLSMRVYVTM